MSKKKRIIKIAMSEEEINQLEELQVYDHRMSYADTIRAVTARAYSRIPKDKRKEIREKIDEGKK